MSIRPPSAPLVGLLGTAGNRIMGGGGPLVGPAITLVSISDTEADYGPWTITLAACRAADGTPPAGTPTPAGFPLDNLIVTAVLPQSLLLRWGGGGSYDELVMDYPFAGGTFTVHAGAVSLQTIGRDNIVLPAPPNVLPNVGAWATPGARANTFQPRFSTTLQASANQAQFVAIPRHAVAYAVAAAGTATVDLRTMTKLVAQVDASNGAILSLDRSVAGGPVWSASTPTFEWTPLVPQATALQFGATGVGLGLDRDVRIMFALDVGG